jgi:TolA-binding protein
MQSKVKLTKRQVKEDKFTTFMLTSKDKLREEFEDKWQYYVIGLVLVVVVVWAIGWHFSRQSAREVEAAEALSRAMVTYQSGDNQVATLELSQIVENYASSSAAEQATYLLGNLSLTSRSYEEAINYYQTYLDNFSGDRINRAAAYAGIATAYENQAQNAEAADSFGRAAAEDPQGPLVADYFYGALRNHLAAGNMEQARSLLTRLEDDYPGSDWTRKAQIRIAEKTAGQ